MKLSPAICILLLSLLACTRAFASPFDDWTLEQIKSHPDFRPIESLPSICYSLSSARESADPASPLTHIWVGFIQHEEHRAVFFDSHGYALTCIDYGYSPGWQPAWPQYAIDWLYELGYYEGYPS